MAKPGGVFEDEGAGEFGAVLDDAGAGGEPFAEECEGIGASVDDGGFGGFPGVWEGAAEGE